MICCFPDPLPDELFYSVCARFHSTMKYRAATHTSMELFGSAAARAAIDLPQRLAHLLSLLPPGHRYTVDSLIEENSLLPFYGAFLPTARVLRLRKVMEGGGHGGISSRSSIRRLEYFQSCSFCVAEDRKRYGRTYWHRIHQAPGVIVCHVHNVPLERRYVELRSKSSRLKFVDAEMELDRNPIQRIRLTARGHKPALQIARDVAWLLSKRNLSCDTKVLHAQYRRLLIEAGFATCKTVRVLNVVEAFTEYYGRSLLGTLHCQVEGYCNWLTELFLQSRSLHNPLHHLLVMQFLGRSLQQFFAVTSQDPLHG